MMVEVPCTGRGGGCPYCRQSIIVDNGSHYISYFIDKDSTWKKSIDYKPLKLTPDQFTYIKVVVPNAYRVHEILEEQVGKPLNSIGFVMNFMFWMKYGVTHETYASDVFDIQRSWICCELFMCILIDQGLGDSFTTEPCQTLPVQLWEQCKKMACCKLLRYHPSRKSQIQLDPLSTRYPPGGI